MSKGKKKKHEVIFFSIPGLGNMMLPQEINDVIKKHWTKKELMEGVRL